MLLTVTVRLIRTTVWLVGFWQLKVIVARSTNLGASWKGFNLSMFFNGMIRDAHNNSNIMHDLFQCWTAITHPPARCHACLRELEKMVFTIAVYLLWPPNSNNEHEVSEFLYWKWFISSWKAWHWVTRFLKQFSTRWRCVMHAFISGSEFVWLPSTYGADPVKGWAILIRCPVRSLWDYHLVSKL